jgi:hypothetical protein
MYTVDPSHSAAEDVHNFVKANGKFAGSNRDLVTNVCTHYISTNLFFGIMQFVGAPTAYPPVHDYANSGKTRRKWFTKELYRPSLTTITYITQRHCRSCSILRWCMFQTSLE